MTIELMIKPGHRLYKYDLNTDTMSEVNRSGDTHHLFKAEYKKGELYASALNSKNARRKFENMMQYILEKFIDNTYGLNS